MPQNPLNASGGSAAVVRARMADADVARLLGLAAREGIKPGTLARKALALGLRELEREDAGPPEPAG